MQNSIQGQLESHRSGLLRSISAAATAAESSKVLELTRELQRIEQLLARHASLLEEASSLLSAPVLAPKPIPPSPQVGLANGLSGRGHGRQIRSEFLATATKGGLVLTGYQGAIYRSPNGTRVGVAVATERQPNRWFLGLTEDAFDAAVLLCHSNSGRTTAVCLPPTFLAQYRAHLSRSRGQNKFNVIRRDAHFLLSIPGKGHIPVDQFVGAIGALA